MSLGVEGVKTQAGTVERCSEDQYLDSKSEGRDP